MAKRKKTKIKNSKNSKKIIEPLLDKPVEKKITISVCMIVKDEERFLDNCLKSIRDIADEIIIIDTGSQDKTVDIAKKYTDRIYFHSWNNNFSEARNLYFKYATGEWIFQIDADEELVKKDHPEVRKAVKNTDIDAIMVQLVSSYRNGQGKSIHNVVRIFKNKEEIHYEGRIHESVTGYLNSKIYPIHLKHYGYDLNNTEKSDLKHHMRIDLLKKDIEENPENPLPYHYLSCCYLPHKLYTETIEAGLKAIELSDKQGNQNPIYLWTRYNVATSYYKLNEHEKTESISLGAIEKESHHLDSHYLLTLVYFDRGEWDKVLEHGNAHLQLSKQILKYPENFSTLMSNTMNETWNTLILTGIAYQQKDLSDKGEEAFKSAISSAPEPFTALRAIGLYYYNQKQWGKSHEYLKKASEINDSDPTIKGIMDKIDKKSRGDETITCCMIVKNEEEFLEKCLSSVKNYVDEIVVVDTGSTDNTVEIAKKFTNKVYFHPWENSFSKARNQALQYATCDWIFQIDGDEELMEGSGERLRNAVRNAKDEDIIFVNIFCAYANNTKKSLHNFERLFRNNGVIHYEGSVHNQIKGGTKASYSSIELWHYGYDVDDDKALQKFERTVDLLKKEIENNPNNPTYHHYLSASYLSRRMFEDAKEEAVKAVELSDQQNNVDMLFAWSHFNASISLLNLGRLEESKVYALKSLKKYPDHMDSYYMLAILSNKEKDWDNVIKYGLLFLELLGDLSNKGRTNNSLENTMNEGPEINILVGQAYHIRNMIEKMEACYQSAYEMCNEKWRISLKIGGKYLDEFDNMEYAGTYLKRAVIEGPDEHDPWYMLAKYYNKCHQIEDEMLCLEKLIEIGTDDIFIYERLFYLFVEANEPDKAFYMAKEMGTRIDKLNPSFYSKLLLLGNHFIEKTDLESAIYCYMKAAEAKPDAHEAWSTLAEVNLLLGNLEDTQIFAEKALNIKDGDIMNLLIMCELKLKLNDFESHINYCDKILASMGLERNRTIKEFNDIKDIFIEIRNSINDDMNYASRINNIINILDTYINPKT